MIQLCSNINAHSPHSWVSRWQKGQPMETSYTCPGVSIMQAHVAYSAFIGAGDFRDAVERACDDFAPERKEAVPLGADTLFTQFTDTDGSKVRVQLSSAAMRECCRVFIEPSERLSQPRTTPNGTMHAGWEPTALHLCRCMAAELRRALDEAFDYTLDDQPRCSTEDE